MVTTALSRLGARSLMGQVYRKSCHARPNGAGPVTGSGGRVGGSGSEGLLGSKLTIPGRIIDRIQEVRQELACQGNARDKLSALMEGLKPEKNEDLIVAIAIVTMGLAQEKIVELETSAPQDKQALLRQAFNDAYGAMEVLAGFFQRNQDEHTLGNKYEVLAAMGNVVERVQAAGLNDLEIIGVGIDASMRALGIAQQRQARGEI